jgi:hypothetical protein
MRVAGRSPAGGRAVGAPSLMGASCKHWWLSGTDTTLSLAEQ